jgi:gas vesicle protein
MKKSTNTKAIGAGIGVAALAAGAAAAYFLTGKGGAKNRKKLSKWAEKAKKEVVKEVKEMGAASQSSYNKAVDVVMKNYKDMQNIDKSELIAFGKELKGHWKAIQGEMQKVVKEAKKLPAKKSTGKSK